MTDGVFAALFHFFHLFFQKRTFFTFQNFHLSQKSLETIRTRLKSAKSALRAATSTYNALKEKFEVGLIDNIAFLDALTQKTLAQSRYKETLFDYEIGKSIYYYYAGKDPKEFIR